jgi:hypothetical protein
VGIYMYDGSVLHGGDAEVAAEAEAEGREGNL